MPGAVFAFVETYATLKAHHPATFAMPIIPGPGGFLPFGITDNGDYLGWIIAPGDPDRWKVAVLQDEDGMPEVTGMSFGPFILAFLRGNFRPEAFPDDLYETLPLGFRTY